MHAMPLNLQRLLTHIDTNTQAVSPHIHIYCTKLFTTIAHDSFTCNEERGNLHTPSACSDFNHTVWLTNRDSIKRLNMINFMHTDYKSQSYQNRSEQGG